MESKNQHDPSVLIELAKQGDSSAFGILYKMYFTPVFRYIYFRVKDKKTAEDLVQSVFLKAYESISGFREQGKDPLAYFFTIARNAVIDYWRKKKEILMEGNEEILDKVRDTEASPLEFIEKGDKAAVLKEAIKNLTDDQQEIINLKFISDLSNAEISKITGKNEDAIRQLQSRALKNLREILKENKLI